ncbi:replication initiation protein [Burkholderia multivorans]|uniref:replication initiation protein n=1 Tax=Burkholderia multivorans TaxID=87883 RepID=UPI0021C06B6B|nr:replication initiation protein [Burkholderia multivorans]
MFEELIDSLPEKVRSTDGFDEGTKFRKREKALGFKYIEHNQLYKKYIVVDVDTPGSAFLWEELGLPPPTIITVNPTTTHCHYLWELKTPVIFTEAGRTQPKRFYENVDSALTHSIPGADPAYVGMFTRNPLHTYWRTIVHKVSYDLADFGEYLDLTPLRKRSELVWNILGRNSTLFDTVRHWAYIAVKYAPSCSVFHQQTNIKAHEINLGFQDLPGGMLPAKEVLSTARSIAEWTWKHRNDNFKNRGVLDLPEDMSLQEKQREGAIYTNEQRTESVEEKIKLAIMRTKEAGRPLTMMHLAKSGLSQSTYYKHRELVEGWIRAYS